MNSRRDAHVTLDHLTALALAVRAPAASEEASDRAALEHVGRCEACAATLARLTVESDELRQMAFAEADAVFDHAMLDAQRTRILDRLAQAGQAARVLAFPARSREVAQPAASGTRRWTSVAAAAGLIIGLLAGQMLHFMPAQRAVSREATATRVGSTVGASPAALLPSVRLLDDDELMEEVEVAVQLRRAHHTLQALDALTPTAADLLALGR